MRKRIRALLMLALMLLFMASPAMAEKGNITEMQAVLKAFIEGKYHWSNVEVTRLEAGAVVLSGPLPEQISLVKGPPGRAVFSLGFADGRTETLTASITAYAPVVKSKRSLKANTFIGPDDISSSQVEISRLPAGGYFDNPSRVTGKELKCSISSGVTITNEMVSSFPLAVRGHKVTIVIESPNFRITAAGVLEESARVGDNVRVMNTSSKKMLSGLLVDENTVSIQQAYGMPDNRITGGYQGTR
ncbi:MAG: flagellar basal body P-ring formation chaperone FlgA [Nitrospiraceae bacterium]|nr:flagellar basal body P-ring formation chaperone FlgA [Nitrospiraceae bacterium]